jgi:hypothetical protein
MIHYARWAILASLPAPDGSGAPWALNWTYLLFDASYDGAEKAYLDSFTDTLPLRIERVFGACYGFQSNVEEAHGADGRPFAAWAFRHYVARNTLEVLARHAAFPHAGVGDVRQALAIERAERRSLRLHGQALRDVQSRVEALALGPPGARAGVREGVLEPWARRVGRPGVRSLIVLAPLTGDPPQGPAADDALGRLPGVHFARVALVGRGMQEHLGQQHPDRLRTDYLLFTCDHDGPGDAWLDRVHTQARDAADALFGACAAYPRRRDPKAFRDWFRRHERPAQYYVTGYPARPVEDLAATLEARARIGNWALGGLGPLAREDRV